jgi:hypothetical protein
MKVRLFTPLYTPKGSAPGYVSCSVTWKYLAAGEGELVLEEDDVRARLLLSAAEVVVPVVVTVAGQRWSGRVSSADLHRDGGPGTGLVTASLVDDWMWLAYLLASPNGANPSVEGMPEADVQTGPVATVAAYFINAAAARLAVPVVALVPEEGTDASPVVTVSGRWEKLSELLVPPLQAAGVALVALMWLPGDPQPPGVFLDRPTVVFRTSSPPPKTWLRWTDSGGGISALDLSVTGGTGYRAVIGLGGEGAAREYDVVVDDDAAAAQGPYAFPEVYADESGTVKGPDSQARGREALLPARPAASAAPQVMDGEPFYFGRHYTAGDVGGISVAGVTATERLSAVTATDDRDNGLAFTPVVGDGTAAASGGEIIGATIAQISQQLHAVQARR